MSEIKLNGITWRHYAGSGRCFKNGLPVSADEFVKALHDARINNLVGGVA